MIKKSQLMLLLVLCLSTPLFCQAEQESRIQLAILLDTSSSMDGLIDQAKSQLWKIVNKLATAKKNGRIPRLEVALYEYGNNGIPKNDGFVRMILPLTTDLDLISEKLFQLQTNGGNEFCGRVIQAAGQELKWSNSHEIYKVIFIAGNEPFNQGKIDYKKACRQVIGKGIIVNTIFCGNYAEGAGTHWKDGADLADGQYMNIDHNYQTVYIQAPQDAEIMRLNQQLNQTYLAYGRRGMEKKVNQAKQDSNAALMSEEAEIQRVVTKSSRMYKNEAWDLIDAVQSGKIRLQDLKKSELPLEMRKMDQKQQKEYLAKMSQKRLKLQEKISRLNQARDQYLYQKRKENTGQSSLETAVIKALEQQASRKNFRF